MTRYESADASPGYLLWRTTLMWQRQITAGLRPFDLTHAQFVLLASILWLSLDASPNQQDLARHAGTEPKMTSELVRKLEHKGLLTRSTDELDTRARRLTLTSDGKRLARRALKAVEDIDEAFFGKNAPDAVDVLRRVQMQAHSQGAESTRT